MINRQISNLVSGVDLFAAEWHVAAAVVERLVRVHCRESVSAVMNCTEGRYSKICFHATWPFTDGWSRAHPILPTWSSLPSAHPREGSGSPFLSCISIFPTATADVDMSNRYRSDACAAGADTQKGFVPKTCITLRKGRQQ